MPHASHRIDMLFVPADPEAIWLPTGFEALCRTWQARQWLSGDGPGPDVEALVPGGFSRVRLDEPGRMVLYANQQGGFQVRCPGTGGNIASAFGVALGAWRHGAPRVMDCPDCGVEHLLDACILRPDGAFGRVALVLGDVNAITMLAEGLQTIEEVMGPSRVVLRRVT